MSISTTAKSGDEIKLKTLADPGPRSATVTAETSAVMLELGMAGFEEFFAEIADSERVVLRNIARVLAQRLRNSNQLLASR